MQIKSWQIALIGFIFSLLGGLSLVYENFSIRDCDRLAYDSSPCQSDIEISGDNPTVALLLYLYPAILSLIIIFFLKTDKAKQIGIVGKIIDIITYTILLTFFMSFIVMGFRSGLLLISNLILLIAGIYHFLNKTNNLININN